MGRASRTRGGGCDRTYVLERSHDVFPEGGLEWILKAGNFTQFTSSAPGCGCHHACGIPEEAASSFFHMLLPVSWQVWVSP